MIQFDHGLQFFIACPILLKTCWIIHQYINNEYTNICVGISSFYHILVTGKAEREIKCNSVGSLFIINGAGCCHFRSMGEPSHSMRMQQQRRTCVFPGCTEMCQFDNFRCRHWRQIAQRDDVMTLTILSLTCPEVVTLATSTPASGDKFVNIMTFLGIGV